MGRQRCAGRLGGKAEFPCGLTVGDGHRRCAGCLEGKKGGVRALVLPWMFVVLCRRVFIDFCWWCGYTEGTYLGTFWAVRLSDPHMVDCKYGGEEPGCCVRVFLLPS